MKVRNNGDTMVEVILSFAIFAVVAVSVSVLMNRGLSIGQQSLEVSLVREQITAQAEMLRFARYDSEDQTAWQEATKPSRLMGGADAAAKSTDCEVPPKNGSFVLYPSADGTKLSFSKLNESNKYVSPDTSSFVGDDGQSHGIRVQVARAENKSGEASALAYDFYIHACWYLPSSNKPQVLTTMVRLYG